MALVHKFDAEIPNKYFSEMLSYMDINEDEFWEVIDKNRPSHIWKKKDNNWELIEPVR